MEKNGKRILVVEDEGLLAMAIEEWLVGDGYEVGDIASTGEGAIESNERLKPDLIIMDIFLEGDMDGIETVKYINEHHSTPIIYVTGNTDLETYNRARETMHYGYYEKPVSKQGLLRVVKETFELIRFKKESGNY
jgi:CheY-like chemotaxis protein